MYNITIPSRNFNPGLDGEEACLRFGSSQIENLIGRIKFVGNYPAWTLLQCHKEESCVNIRIVT